MSTFDLWFLLMLVFALALLVTAAALVSIVLEQAKRIRSLRQNVRAAATR